MGSLLDTASNTTTVRANTSSLYSKISSLLAFPYSLISHMWDVLNHDTKPVFDLKHHGQDVHATSMTRSSPPPLFTPLPGPWSFLTSGYIAGLIVMAILLHRIQNIVVPPRHAYLRRFNRNQPQRYSSLRAIYYSIFPLDFSSAKSRFIFRLPSLYFVTKSLFMWAMTLLQMSNHIPLDGSTWLQTSSHWVAHEEMADICWLTFCAVCGALCVEALTRGLEGGTANASPFNLFGYAFLLHIYSSPMTHDFKLEGIMSRPDKHVIYTIIFPLLQLTMIHLIGIRRCWSHQRLIPSTIVSILSLTHFHAVLWFTASSYPLLNYLPCLFESILVSATVLAIFLNVMTQVLTEGSITRPMFGHHATLLPKWDEDFSIALLRVGTASLEATSVAGLGNEVGGVSALKPTIRRLQTEYGTVEMNRFGVTSISPMVEETGHQRRRRNGFANEIRSVKATINDGDLWIDMAWYRELAKFGVGVGRCLRGMWRLFWGAIRGLSFRHDTPMMDLDQDVAPPVEEHELDERDPYQQFMRGENVSDDDEDFEPQRSRSCSLSSPSSAASDMEDDENSPLDQRETVDLLEDLASGKSTAVSPQHLFVHMASQGPVPLTRRQYSSLITPSTDSAENDDRTDNWTEIAYGQQSPRTDNATTLDDSRRNCVVCLAVPRQIICWPCRCLALCDDCRENLATRASASKHICPCCRRNVEGYSKIYIP